MESEQKNGVSSRGSFLIGLILGAGIILVYHALESRAWREELQRTNRMAEEYRSSAAINKSERLRLESETQKSPAPVAPAK